MIDLVNINGIPSGYSICVTENYWHSMLPIEFHCKNGATCWVKYLSLFALSEPISENYCNENVFYIKNIQKKSRISENFISALSTNCME